MTRGGRKTLVADADQQNACMTVSKAGFEVTVEDAKSLSATAWIPTNVFGSYTYTGEGAEVFELSLDALLQCLNIFGSAGGSGVGPAGSGRERRMRRVPPNATGAAGKKRWAGDVEDEDEEDWAALPGKRKEQRTSMRLAWSGLGHPLTVLL
jgi:cell cycle checkpoint protein